MKKIAAIAVTALIAAGPAFADGDVDAGEKVFRKCRACHLVGENATARVGPVLNNLFGRTAGTNEEYGARYSKAMVEAGQNGLVWTEEVLMEYLIKPRDYVNGTKMAFAGLAKEQDREDVIAYLKQFSPDYKPAEE
jgi:cytochrome c2